jgi:integrase
VAAEPTPLSRRGPPPIPSPAGRACGDDDPIFVRLGRHRGVLNAEPLFAQAVHKLVRRYGLDAGIAERLCHPHALRAYWATVLLEDGMPVHVVSARLGHADLRTTGRYAVDRAELTGDVADLLDRRHQTARRARR